MSAQHTPGPWDCTGCLFPDDDMGGVYYRVQADGMDARAANARLIAAAPELLEALETAMRWIKAWDVGFLFDEEWPADEAAINAAIAKARGAA